MLRSIALGLGLAAMLGPAALAQAPVSPCLQQIRAQEKAQPIPPNLLLAIGIEESGLNPFALNVHGKPYFPPTAQDAAKLVTELQAKGARLIDVGCMQINLHHHKDRVSLTDVLDPARNVAYGARYLLENFGRFGSWPLAVAHYHSGNPERQKIYLERVNRRLSLIAGGAPLPMPRLGPTPETGLSVFGPMVMGLTGRSLGGRAAALPDMRSRWVISSPNFSDLAAGLEAARPGDSGTSFNWGALRRPR